MTTRTKKVSFLSVAIFTGFVASCGDSPSYPTQTNEPTSSPTGDGNTVAGNGNTTVQNPNGSGTTPAACNSNDTWDGYAAGFFAKNCASCHGAGKTPGTSFYDPNSYSSVAAAAQRISAAISSGSMPKGGTLDAADKSRILSWLACSPPPQN